MSEKLKKLRKLLKDVKVQEEITKNLLIDIQVQIQQIEHEIEKIEKEWWLSNEF